MTEAKDQIITKIKSIQYIVITLLCIVWISEVNAQADKNPLWIKINLGSSIPVGGFSNTSLSSGYLGNADGFAKTGLHSAVSLGYRLKKYYSILLSAGFNSNKQNQSAFSRSLTTQLGNGSQVAVTTRSWNILTVTGGGNITIPLSSISKLSLQIQAEAGGCKTSVPAFKYQYQLINGTGGSVTLNSVSLPMSFCYRINTGISYRLSAAAHLLLEAGYFNSSPSLKYSYYSGLPGSSTLIEGNKKLSLSCLNFSTGMLINL